MGVGAGLYMYFFVVQKFTFAISSPDEFLLVFPIILYCIIMRPVVTDVVSCMVSLTAQVGWSVCHDRGTQLGTKNRALDGRSRSPMRIGNFEGKKGSAHWMEDL